MQYRCPSHIIQSSRVIVTVGMVEPVTATAIPSSSFGSHAVRQLPVIADRAPTLADADASRGLSSVSSSLSSTHNLAIAISCFWLSAE